MTTAQKVEGNMLLSSMGKGLCEKITQARSDEEIDALLIMGTRFENASSPTRRRWIRKAEKRRADLQQYRERFQESWERPLRASK